MRIPMPEGKMLFPYQEEGVRFLARRKKAYLTDEMGLGKTIQVIGLANLVSPKRILIVCPASLKFNWVGEFKKFSTNPYKIQIVKSSSTIIKDSSDILIVSYGVITNAIEKFRLLRFDLIVLDESHYIKNFLAKRTKAITTLNSEYKVALTGTPILNRPAEIFATVNWLNSSVLGNRHSFLVRHCSQLVRNSNTGFMMESWRGAHHIEEVREKLFSTVMIRRRKKEVLDQLPPKTRQVIEVEGLKRAAKKKHKELFQEFVKVEELIENLSSRKQFSRDFLNELVIERQRNALEKVPYCAKYIIDLLESREKLVVFAHHREVIKNLREHLLQKKIGVVQYIGGMSDGEKASAVNRFQNDSSIQVFIGSMRAAGIGITLSASDLVLFLELDFTPAIMLQAEDRVHRIGQTRNVLIQYFVFKYGIDSMIIRLLMSKLEINNELLGDDKKIF